MAEASSFEGTGLVNNGDGITLKYAVTILENSFFAVNYAIQSHLNAAKLYRKNHFSTLMASLLDYLHVIPFLVHRKYLCLSARARFLTLFFSDRGIQLWRSLPCLGKVCQLDSTPIANLHLCSLLGMLPDSIRMLRYTHPLRPFAPILDCLLGDSRLECHPYWALCICG